MGRPLFSQAYATCEPVVRVESEQTPQYEHWTYFNPFDPDSEEFFANAEVETPVQVLSDARIRAEFAFPESRCPAEVDEVVSDWATDAVRENGFGDSIASAFEPDGMMPRGIHRGGVHHDICGAAVSVPRRQNESEGFTNRVPLTGALLA